MRAKRKKPRRPSALSFKVSGLLRSARQAAKAKKMNKSFSLADLSVLGVAASGSPNPATTSSSATYFSAPGSPSVAGSGHVLGGSLPVMDPKRSSVDNLSLPPVVEASHDSVAGSSYVPASVCKDSPPSNAASNQVQNYASLLKSSVQLQVLGSPSEHVSGAPYVLIPDENIEAAKLEFKDFAYARFHGDYPLMGKIIGVVNAVWAKTGLRIFVHNIGQGIYLLRVTNPRAREVLLSRTCWNIGGLPMFVAPWSPEYSPDEPPLTSAIIPVELQNVPYLLFNRESLSRIATAVGKPESLFPETERKENLAVAKLYVRVDLTAPLPHRIISGFSNGKEVQIDVSYPWLPVKCEACKRFGHNKDKCSVQTQKDLPEHASPKKESTETTRRRSKSRPGRSMDKKSKKVELRYVPIFREGERVSEAKENETRRPTDKENATLEEATATPDESSPPALTPSDVPASSSLSQLPLTTHPHTPSDTVEVHKSHKASNINAGKDFQRVNGSSLSVPATDQSNIPQSAGELEREKPFFLVKNRKSGRKVTNRQ
ncbi:hypothetical protein N665_0077s0009 [Sinapis alba]|nr:hypothetical protein N665_0077s0009 [Sinapis alba]